MKMRIPAVPYWVLALLLIVTYVAVAVHFTPIPQYSKNADPSPPNALPRSPSGDFRGDSFMPK